MSPRRRFWRELRTSADDLVGVTLAGIGQRDVQAQRVCRPAKKRFAKALVDHAHRPAAGAILLGNLASQHHRNAHRRKVAGPDLVVARAAIVASGRRVAVDDDLVAVVGAREQPVVRVGRAAHGRHGADAGEQRVERDRLARRIVARGVAIHADRQHILFRIPEIDLLEVDERPHQQPRADQQRQRQRQLPDDHELADPQPCRPSRRCRGLARAAPSPRASS